MSRRRLSPYAEFKDIPRDAPCLVCGREFGSWTSGHWCMFMDVNGNSCSSCHAFVPDEQALLVDDLLRSRA